MVDPQRYPVTREVCDVYGRSYRIGASDRDLLGRSRTSVLVAAWAAMFAVSVGQYGFGVILPALGADHDWPVAGAAWLLPIWAAAQAIAVAVAHVGRRVAVAPMVSVLAGAVLCAGGLAALASARDFWQLALGYGIASGIGSGLVYGSCLRVVARWYPERARAVSIVSGAFAYGAVPVLLILGVLTTPHRVVVALDVTAIAVVVVAGLASVALHNPPSNWWPANVDPRVWAVDKTVNAGLRDNWPAIRRYAPAELLGCPTAWLMYVVVVCVSAGCLFDVGYLAVSAERSGWGWSFAIAGAMLFAAAGGLVRAPAGLACDRFGRRRVLLGALVVGAVGQLVLLGSVRYDWAALFIVGACLAGLGLGAAYALLPRVVGGYFGDGVELPNFGVLYSAKGLGGVLGVAAAAIAGGVLAGFVVVAVLVVVAAALVPLLHRPGRAVLVRATPAVVRP